MYIKHILVNFAVYVQNFFLHLHGTRINLVCSTHQFISIVVYMRCDVQNAMVNATGFFTFCWYLILADFNLAMFLLMCQELH